MAGPSIADLDGDGQLEFVMSLEDSLGGGHGAFQIRDLPGSADDCVLWPTGRGDWLRQDTCQWRVGALGSQENRGRPARAGTRSSQRDREAGSRV